MPGCGSCGKRREAQQTRPDPAAKDEWVCVMPNGSTTLHATQLAAKAHNARNGGRGLVKKRP